MLGNYIISNWYNKMSDTLIKNDNDFLLDSKVLEVV